MLSTNTDLVARGTALARTISTLWTIRHARSKTALVVFDDTLCDTCNAKEVRYLLRRLDACLEEAGASRERIALQPFLAAFAPLKDHQVETLCAAYRRARARIAADAVPARLVGVGERPLVAA